MYGLKNSYINFFIIISQFSPQASWCDVYAFMVVTMKKSGKLQLEDRVFAFFCYSATRSQLSFLNSLITRAPSSGNWCRYPIRSLALSQQTQKLLIQLHILNSETKMENSRVRKPCVRWYLTFIWRKNSPLISHTKSRGDINILVMHDKGTRVFRNFEVENRLNTTVSCIALFCHIGHDFPKQKGFAKRLCDFIIRCHF